jgi:hypothetical protein
MEKPVTEALATGHGSYVWEPPARIGNEAIKTVVCGFLDTVTTSFGRATHYNSREEQQKAELSSHSNMLKFDRSLYTVFLTLPGVTTRSSQIGVKTLLGTPRTKEDGFLNADLERKAIEWLVSNTLPQRVLKMFQAFCIGDESLGIRKANNARTRKLILRTILNAPNLELWSVKYRKKVKAALTHAWGERRTSIIKAILAKPIAAWNLKEEKIIATNIVKHAAYLESSIPENLFHTYEYISFILGNAHPLGLRPRSALISSFFKARNALFNGKCLPPEVLEGIRSTYHQNAPKETVIELTSKSMTKTQRLQVQKRADSAGIKVDMDPRDYDPIQLYIYAFENGMTEEIETVLQNKAYNAACNFPAKYNKIGILVDTSKSMEGDETQKLRLQAAVLAMRDVLQQTASTATTWYCGDSGAVLPRPRGATALAVTLLKALSEKPDAVFILSDGYENSPAGRTHEVIGKLRQIKNTTPIYHINPVYAAEVGSVKELAPGLVPTLPVNDPKALGTAFVRGLLEVEPIKGINALLSIALPQLLSKHACLER